MQDNLATLRRRGVHVVDPESGRLAGGDVGEGRLADPAGIVGRGGERARRGPDDLAGVRVLVTAGGTREPIDAVRIITNRSSGKQGYAIAEVAARRGAAVTLVTTIGRPAPPRVEIVSRADRGRDAGRGAGARRGRTTSSCMAAAVADFRPKEPPTASSRSTRASPRSCSSPPTTSSSTSGATSPPVRCWSGSRPRPTTCVEQRGREAAQQAPRPHRRQRHLAARRRASRSTPTAPSSSTPTAVCEALPLLAKIRPRRGHPG